MKQLSTGHLQPLPLVHGQIEEMQKSGDLKDLNRDFKAARVADPKLRYQDYLHSRKAVMLQALAVQAARR
jgi:hypothetical protein